jgi:hypothetical protein
MKHKRLSRLQKGDTNTGRSQKMKANVVLLIALFGVLLAMAPLEVLAAEAESEHESEGHDFHHHVGLFLGNTHTDHDDGFTFGLDYEYRLNERLGLAGLVDYATDIESTVVGAGVFIHLLEDVRLLLAPGFENHHGDNEYLFRTGVYYDMSLGEWDAFPEGELTVSPTFIVDFVDGEEDVVIGLTLGYEF